MPPLELVIDLLLTVVLPGVAGCVIVGSGLARLLGPRWRHFAVAIGAAAGMAIGNWQRNSLPYWPEYEGWPWLLPIAAAALLAGAAISAGLSRPGATDALLRYVLFAIAAIAIGWRLMPAEFLAVGPLLYFAALGLANAIVLDQTARRHPGRLLPAAWAIVLAGGAALVCIYAASGRLFDGGAMLAAALLGIALLIARPAPSCEASALAVGLFLPALMLSAGHATFSEVPTGSFVLAAAAPLSYLVLLVPTSHTPPPWERTVLLFALPLVPVMLALGLAIGAVGFELGY